MIFPFPINEAADELIDKNRLIIYEVTSSLMDRYKRFANKYTVEETTEGA